MPCNEYEEFLFPRCSKIEEIWPAILTKALIKLYSFKTKTSQYYEEEIGDCSIIYSLTGYIGKTTDFDLNSKPNKLDNLIKFRNVLSEDFFIPRRKLLLVFNPKQKEKLKKRKSMNLLNMLSRRKQSSRAIPSNFSKGKTNLSTKKSFMRSNIDLPSKLNKIEILRYSNKSATSKWDLSVYNTEDVPNPKSNEKENQVSQFKIRNAVKKAFDPVRNKHNESYMDKIYLDFAYSLIDMFCNDDFNMDRLNQIHLDQDLAASLNFGASYRELSKENKIKYLEELQKARAKNKEFKESKIRSLRSRGNPITYFGIKTDSIGVLNLTTYGNIPYTNAQIEMAKVCNLNNWKFPPISYYLEIVERQEDLQSPDEKTKGNKTAKATRKELIFNFLDNFHQAEDNQIDEKEINLNSPDTLKKLLNQINLEGNSPFKSHKTAKYVKKNTFRIESQLFNKLNKEEFRTPAANSSSKNIRTRLSSISLISLASPDIGTKKTKEKERKKIRENYHIVNDGLVQYNEDTALKPAQRPEFEWVDMKTMALLFSKAAVLSNPWAYRFSLCLDFSLKDPLVDMFALDMERSVFVLRPGTREITRSNSLRGHGYHSLLVQFESISDAYLSNKPFISLQLVHSSKDSPMDLTLCGYFDCETIDNLNPSIEYYLIIQGCNCINGFFLGLFSDHEIENISYYEYMKTYRHFTAYRKSIELQAMSQGELYVLFKSKFQCSQGSEILIKFDTRDNYLNEFLEVIVESDRLTKPSKQYRRKLSRDESIKIQANEDPFICILIVPPFNVEVKRVDLELLCSQRDFEVREIPLERPFEVSDCISIRKNGTFLQEFLHFAEPERFTYLALRLSVVSSKEKATYKKAKKQSKVKIISGYGNALDKEKPRNPNIQNSHTPHKSISLRLPFEHEAQPMKEDIENTLLSVELAMNSSVIFSTSIPNNTLIHNITIPPQNPQAGGQVNSHPIETDHSPYVLTCSVNPREFSDLKSSFQGSSWSILVFASQEVTFEKDSSRQDEESRIIFNWETQQQGRSDKAKQSRLRYLESLGSEMKGSLYSTPISSCTPVSFLPTEPKRRFPVIQKSLNIQSFMNYTLTQDKKLLCISNGFQPNDSREESTLNCHDYGVSNDSNACYNDLAFYSSVQHSHVTSKPSVNDSLSKLENRNDLYLRTNEDTSTSKGFLENRGINFLTRNYMNESSSKYNSGVSNHIGLRSHLFPSINIIENFSTHNNNSISKLTHYNITEERLRTEISERKSITLEKDIDLSSSRIRNEPSNPDDSQSIRSFYKSYYSKRKIKVRGNESKVTDIRNHYNQETLSKRQLEDKIAYVLTETNGSSLAELIDLQQLARRSNLKADFLEGLKSRISRLKEEEIITLMKNWKDLKDKQKSESALKKFIEEVQANEWSISDKTLRLVCNYLSKISLQNYNILNQLRVFHYRRKKSQISDSIVSSRSEIASPLVVKKTQGDVHLYASTEGIETRASKGID